MNAYDNFAVMTDYAVRWCGIGLRDFYDRFLQSGIASAMESGHPRFLYGLSGIELAMKVMENTGGSLQGNASYSFPYSDSEYYWTGWALFQYREHKGVSFQDIDSHGLPVEKVLTLFNPLHEAPITKFFVVADGFYKPGSGRLKQLRKASGLTQEQLGKLCGVSLRMIRAYEQGSQSLSHANAQTLLSLSRVLCCSPEALILE